MGFRVVRLQVVERGGVSFANFVMERPMTPNHALQLTAASTLADPLGHCPSAAAEGGR
jgi:hypothetical protein